MSTTRVRPLEAQDWSEWRRMMTSLHPDDAVEELEDWMHTVQSNTGAAVFVAERPDGSVCGYVEAGTRPYADGCSTSPVGYIEGWYVDSDVRERGVGRALLGAAEAWARARGCREMGSDALIDNIVSHAAHTRSGYEEVERLVVFRKQL